MTRIAQTGTIFGALFLGVFPAMAQQFGLGSVGVGSNKDTMWVSICPPGTTIVSGSCIAPVGSAVSLQSFGMDSSAIVGNVCGRTAFRKRAYGLTALARNERALS